MNRPVKLIDGLFSKKDAYSSSVISICGRAAYYISWVCDFWSSMLILTKSLADRGVRIYRIPKSALLEQLIKSFRSGSSLSYTGAMLPDITRTWGDIFSSFKGVNTATFEASSKDFSYKCLPNLSFLCLFVGDLSGDMPPEPSNKFSVNA